MPILDELKKKANGKADSANNIAEAIAQMDFSEGGVTPEEIAESVSAYLDEHLTNPTNPPIDTSLSISGAAADAKETGDKYDQLKEELNAIATVEAEQTEIVLNKSDLDTSYDSTYVNEGYISGNGNFTASSGYRTYYYQATKSLSVYLETAGEFNSSLSLAVYNTSISISAFVARYRSTDGDLPTKENRLSITTGQWVAVTIYSSNAAADFDFGTRLYESGASAVTPTDAFVEAINKLIEIPVGFVGRATKTATALVINIGKLKYEVNKYSNATIRAYMWRTNACKVLDANGTYQTIWTDSDSDGVVKISGESDFIGGYHGDETETMFHLFIDGVEYGEDSTFEDLAFKEIILYFESDVYHCNNSSTPDVVAFKRNKIIKFNDEGYIAENYWIAQEDLTCEASYIGMLSVENGMINAYYTNQDYKYHALDSGVSRSADITEVCFNTPYGDIGLKVYDPVPNEHYSCAVAAYTGRLKAYAANFATSAHGALSVGDVIKGKAVIFFRG